MKYMVFVKFHIIIERLGFNEICKDDDYINTELNVFPLKI